MENQLDSVTEKPTRFLRLQGLACDWSKHNKHSRNIFSVHGFLRLSVIRSFSMLFSYYNILYQYTWMVIWNLIITTPPPSDNFCFSVKKNPCTGLWI